MGYYDVSCIICGSESNLNMFAHRNKSNNLVGWVFSCPKCSDKVAGMNITLQPWLEKPKPPKSRILKESQVKEKESSLRSGD